MYRIVCCESTRVKMSVGSAVLEQPLDSGLEA